ncbi:hypothetical protein C8R47DRAFT_1074180 [Mycena vitilis]|nr:hypothetical protein C8R47DRAFT_1074180 [Mycena vitilis]
MSPIISLLSSTTSARGVYPKDTLLAISVQLKGARHDRARARLGSTHRQARQPSRRRPWHSEARAILRWTASTTQAVTRTLWVASVVTARARQSMGFSVIQWLSCNPRTERSYLLSFHNYWVHFPVRGMRTNFGCIATEIFTDGCSLTDVDYPGAGYLDPAEPPLDYRLDFSQARNHPIRSWFYNLGWLWAQVGLIPQVAADGGASSGRLSMYFGVCKGGIPTEPQSPPNDNRVAISVISTAAARTKTEQHWWSRRRDNLDEHRRQLEVQSDRRTLRWLVGSGGRYVARRARRFALEMATTRNSGVGGLFGASFFGASAWLGYEYEYRLRKRVECSATDPSLVGGKAVFRRRRAPQYRIGIEVGLPLPLLFLPGGFALDISISIGVLFSNLPSVPSGPPPKSGHADPALFL